MSHSAELKMNSQGTEVNKNFIAFLALFIIPISGLSIDIYVPSLPAVSDFFGVDKAFAQLTITAYMLGLGLMQLFAGPISDSFGRRKPFLIAMLLFIVATLLIPFSHSINQLLCLRLLQGMSVALTVVPIRSVISDLYTGPEYYKMASYMTMAWSIGPIIAPAIGGYLQHYFGWQANFYFLGIYSLISFCLNARYLPNTSTFHHQFNMCGILVRYKEMLLNKDYIIGITLNGLLYSIIILFTIVGPFLIQNVLHYSPIEFGHIALLTGLAWFLGTMINRFLIHVPLQKKSMLGFSLMLVIACIALLLDIVIPMNIYLIVIPILFLLVIGGIIFPSNFARSLTLFPKSTGSANALFGSFIFMLTGLTSGLGTFLKSTSELPLTITYVVLIGACLSIQYFFSAQKTST